ncbi:hypothetical protein BH11PSE2_BH11PSE2_14170 [soil metagenome]
MNAPEVLQALTEANLAAATAIIGVLILRRPASRWFGARAGYALWLIVPLAALATMLPARTYAPLDISTPMATPQADLQPPVDPVIPELSAMTSDAKATVAVVETEAPWAPDAVSILVMLWLSGMAASAIFFGLRQWRFLKVAGGDGIGPAVIGFVRPRIILPADFELRFSAEERQIVLAHETAHLAAQDARINAAVVAAQCACWFNPLVHLAAHLMRIDQELACDAAVIDRFPKARAVYAEALLKTQLAATPLPAGCYWPPRSPHPLHRRIAMLKRALPAVRRRKAGAILVSAAALTAALTAWAAQPAVAAKVSPRRQLTIHVPSLGAHAQTIAQAIRRAAPLGAKRSAAVPVGGQIGVQDVALVAGSQPTPSTANLGEPATGDASVQAAQLRFNAAKTQYQTGLITQLDLRKAELDLLWTQVKANGPNADGAAWDRVFEKQLELTRAHANDARRQFEVGFATRNDVKRAELDELRAEIAGKEFDLASSLLYSIREEYKVGLRNRSDVSDAEAELVEIEARFRPAAGARVGANIVTRPTWVRQPTAQDVARNFPERAARLEKPGSVRMTCRVASTGALESCEIAAQTPGDLGFGEAALRLAPLFQMAPTTQDGGSVAGASVTVPIAFDVDPPKLTDQPAPGFVAFAAIYDGNAPYTIKARIVSVDWINPHTQLHVVDLATGQPWVIESGTPNTLRRGGIGDMPAGLEIDVRGFKAKDKACRPECKAMARDITFPDGRKVFIGVGSGFKPRG